MNLTLVNVRVFIFDILTFETLETDFKRFNPDRCVSLKKTLPHEYNYVNT